MACRASVRRLSLLTFGGPLDGPPGTKVEDDGRSLGLHLGLGVAECLAVLVDLANLIDEQPFEAHAVTCRPMWWYDLHVLVASVFTAMRGCCRSTTSPSPVLN